ncbi:Ltp family lipoprotein [Arcanobacterium hippocoleae]
MAQTQGVKSEKPFYQRIWFIIIVAIVAIGGISAYLQGKDETGSSSAKSTSVTEKSTESKSPKNQQEKAEKSTPDVPKEYENALRKAESYSDMMHMSKQGIYDQLTSKYGEKFSPEAAQYAVDNLKADFKKNALEKAKSYEETMNMSPDAIKDQLTSAHGEKFTPEEAQWAIENLGK